MPNINLTGTDGDLGNRFITKDYLMTVYPQIAGQLITPELWSWGWNIYGQLGNNTSVDRSIPVTTFAGETNWKQISTGRFNTAAIKTDGTLWGWGLNGSGQLGDNTSVNRSTPVTTFAGGTNWKQIACGNNHTAAIKTDGTLWTWGSNFNGELGDNTTTNRLTPVTTFAGGTNWKQVSGGSGHTAAIKTDGTLWTWGYNIFGQLGNNTTTHRSTPVTTFAGGTNWKQVSGGGTHTAAIKTDGTLWTWGSNSNGQLGDNTGTTRSTPVTTFAGGTNWKQVAGGGLHIAAIKTDGTLWTWGYNIFGQLGDNTTTNRSIPVTTFAGGTTWKQVDGGDSYTAAIKTDGTLWGWGVGGSGQLGDNTTTNRTTPVTTFAGGTNWKQVSCGDSHTVAIKTSDDLQGI
jgi:alpha-tubulin suppressor-like RCC1 family protein